MENQTKVTVEKRGSLVSGDWIKAFIAAVVIPALQFLYQYYQTNGNIDGVNWIEIGVTAAIAFLSLIGIQLGQPTKVVVENPTEKTLYAVKRAV